MRISLHIKLAITHLAVAGLVLLSTLFYLRTVLNRELQESIQHDLEKDLIAIGANLARTSPERRAEMVALVREVVPHRVAIFDLQGRPIAAPASSFVSRVDWPPGSISMWPKLSNEAQGAQPDQHQGHSAWEFPEPEAPAAPAGKLFEADDLAATFAHQPSSEKSLSHERAPAQVPSDVWAEGRTETRQESRGEASYEMPMARLDEVAPHEVSPWGQAHPVPGASLRLENSWEQQGDSPPSSLESLEHADAEEFGRHDSPHKSPSATKPGALATDRESPTTGQRSTAINQRAPATKEGEAAPREEQRLPQEPPVLSQNQSAANQSPANQSAPHTVPGLAPAPPTPLSPELAQALESGMGRAVRPDRRGVPTIYAAARFPLDGPPMGLIRLGLEAAVVDADDQTRFPFFNRAGAAALSFAIFLSLGAAWVAGRPLRRIAAAAHAFAAGDFGHPVGIESSDELGEAARALEELASQLRDRLLASGADRAALHALLNELPVGVIIFDARGTPLAINGKARIACGFSPGDELDKAERLLELASQAPLVKQVLEQGIAQETTMVLPWLPHNELPVRWVALYAPDGSRQPALIFLDGEPAPSILATRSSEGQTLPLLLWEASSEQSLDSALASRLALAALRLAATTALPAPSPERIVSVESTEVIKEALRRTSPIAREAEVLLELPSELASGLLADCDDRLLRATSWFLAEVIGAAPGAGRLRLRLRRTERSLQIVARTTHGKLRMEAAARLLLPLGGDASSARDGDMTVSRLELPLA